MIPSFLRPSGALQGSAQANQAQQPSVDQGLLTPAQAAEYLGTTVKTLAQWRCTKRVTLPFVKIGKSVRYRREDIERLIAAGHRS